MKNHRKPYSIEKVFFTKITLFLFLFSFLLHPLNAQENSAGEKKSIPAFVVDTAFSEQKIDLRTYASLLEDSVKEYRFEDLSKFESKGRFIRFSDSIALLSGDSDWWVILEIRNPTQRVIEKYLQIGNAELIEVRVLENRQNPKKYLTGYMQNIENIAIKRYYANDKIPLMLNPQTNYQLYIKLSGSYGKRGISINLNLINPDSFHNSIKYIDAIIWFFLGGIFLFFLYNFCIYFIFKNLLYLYYAGYLFFIFLLLGSSSDFFADIFHFSPQLNFAIVQMLPFHVTFYILYLRKYTNSRIVAPTWDKIFNVAGIIHLLAIVVFYIPSFITGKGSGVFAIYSLVVGSFCIFYSFFLLFKIRKTALNFFAIGNLLLFIFTIPATAFELPFYWEYLYLVGITLEILMFSLGLGYQILEIEKEKRKAQSEMIDIQKRQNVLLEERVEERTLEIDQQKREMEIQAKHLEKMNQIKSRLFSIISHDLRTPIVQLEGILALTEDGELTHEELQYILVEVNKNVRYTAELTNNLLYWAKSQMSGTTLNIVQLDLQEIVKEQVSFFEKASKTKDISIKNEITAAIPVQVDRNMIELVIRNLMSNAVKFCDKNGIIHLQYSFEQPKVKISIKDTGKGISQDDIAKIFGEENFSTRGTHNEKGTGLGLKLCKEFVEKNRGEIWVESELGVGSIFYFTLPLTISS